MAMRWWQALTFIRCEVSDSSLLFFVGQCVSFEIDRHKGVRSCQFLFYKSMRDVKYTCELVTRDSKSWWTTDKGYCLLYSLDYRTWSLGSTAITDKFALSNGLDQDCKSKSAPTCRSVVIHSCLYWYLIYPESGSLLLPYVNLIYTDVHRNIV
jgi:hypothetical protein